MRHTLQTCKINIFKKSKMIFKNCDTNHLIEFKKFAYSYKTKYMLQYELKYVL